MKRGLIKLAVLAVILALGGFLFAWSGLFNIGASTGHWAITEWFLHFAMRNSVETHSMGIEAPPLDDPALVAKGAGHFNSGCAPCHGSPGVGHRPVASGMTPAPPGLIDHVAKWEPQELFWIVKHGVKFTGMPAWPARHRDDEVWAVTAFLLKLPDLDAEAYRCLAFGEAETTGATTVPPATGFEDIVDFCSRCHGKDGTGRGLGAFPILAGQSELYLHAALMSYASGLRPSGVMQLAIRGLDDETLNDLARHYASVKGPKVGAAADACDAGKRWEPLDAALIEVGREIATDGVPKAGVPACASCHGPAKTPRHPLYPALAGQYRDYLALQLRLFRDGVRGGTPYAHLMTTIGDRLNDEHIEAVTAYYASLAGEDANAGGLACGTRTQ